MPGNKPAAAIIGLGGMGAAATGVASLMVVLLRFLGGDFLAAGALPIAAALSVGLLRLAVLGR